MSEQIGALVEPVVREMGLQLWELEFVPGRRRSIVRLFIDAEAGVTLDDCAAVSERVSLLLDAEDPIPGAYNLEVASPGTDRRLRGPEDYRRFMGERVRVVTGEPVEGSTLWTGHLEDFSESLLILRLSEESKVEIPEGLLDQIRLDPFPEKPDGKRRKR